LFIAIEKVLGCHKLRSLEVQCI